MVMSVLVTGASSEVPRHVEAEQGAAAAAAAAAAAGDSGDGGGTVTAQADLLE
jgi:hypothetical protein